MKKWKNEKIIKFKVIWLLKTLCFLYLVTLFWDFWIFGKSVNLKPYTDPKQTLHKQLSTWGWCSGDLADPVSQKIGFLGREGVPPRHAPMKLSVFFTQKTKKSHETVFLFAPARTITQFAENQDFWDCGAGAPETSDFPDFLQTP